MFSSHTRIHTVYDTHEGYASQGKGGIHKENKLWKKKKVQNP